MSASRRSQGFHHTCMDKFQDRNCAIHTMRFIRRVWAYGAVNSIKSVFFKRFYLTRPQSLYRLSYFYLTL